MNYNEFKEIWGEGADSEYIVHCLEEWLSSIARETARIMVSKISDTDTAAVIYSFSLMDYKKMIGGDNITVSTMKKAFKELKKVSKKVKLTSGNITIKYFDKVSIPLFGKEIKYQLNKKTFPYLQQFRR